MSRPSEGRDVDWPAMFDGDDHAAALELAGRLADARELSVGAAQKKVYAAEDAGTLVEADAGGPSVLRLADTAENNPEEPGSGGVAPTPDAGETPGQNGQEGGE
jgi:hypothetical protein